jgi:FSR family fosmidomycin resistance protein-like MFS transporter
MVAVYAATHFLVDLACAFLMFRSLAGSADWYLYVLLYNFCAFAMQMPLGIIADKWNRNFLFAASGCILVATAYGLLHFPLAAVITVGLGNAMFHIGGGIDVLNISEQKSGALGVFVAPGALGVYFGTILGKGSGFPTLPILLALPAAAGFIFALSRAQGAVYPKNAEFALEGFASKRILLAAACLFLVVCLRSYIGLALNLPWKSLGHWGLAVVCAVVTGKIAGGFAADRCGMQKTAVLSLGLAALLLLFSLAPLPGIAAVLLFNMSMPITLWAMAKIFPNAKGFSFGLLAFGLFLGFLPVYLGAYIPASASWVFALGAAVSLALLWAGLRGAKL